MKPVSLVEKCTFSGDSHCAEAQPRWVFVSHLPARNPLGKYKILSKGGCLGWEPPGTSETVLMTTASWLLGSEGGRQTFLILGEDSHRSLQHIVTFASGLFHLAEGTVPPTLILFQRVTPSQPQQPCQEKEKMKGWSMKHLEISRRVLPQLKRERSWGWGWREVQKTTWRFPHQSLQPFYLRCPRSVLGLGPALPSR